MRRTVDSHSGIGGRQAANQMGAIRAGLANGSMVRGLTEREARGSGKPPTWGAILLPGHVDAVTPVLWRGQDAVAWEVIGQVTVEGKGWRAVVVGIRAAVQSYQADRTILSVLPRLVYLHVTATSGREP